MTADPQAPLTEAGRALLTDCRTWDHYGAPGPGPLGASIAAVEAEASANERARLAALVEWIGGNDACFCDADRSLCIDEVYVSRDAVLRLLREGAAG